jgi:hypothetical protein
MQLSKTQLIQNSRFHLKIKLVAIIAIFILTTVTVVYSAKFLEVDGSLDVEGEGVVRGTESDVYRQYVERLSGEPSCEDERV